MLRNVTPERAIAFTQSIVALTCCWPPDPSATKYRLFRFKILRCAAFLNTFALLLPLLYAIHVHRDDAEGLSKAVCLSVAITQSVIQTCFYIVQFERFQRLIEEMNVCCRNAKSYERQVFQKYVNKYSTFYGVSALWFYATAISMNIGALFITDPFPSNAVYPFFVDFQPVRTIIFLHQSLAAMQCAAHICISIHCALLLLFTAARFEILTIELGAIRNIASLIDCMKKYHSLKRYATEVVNAVRFIALLVVSLCAIAAVFCGLSFIGQLSFTVKLQFTFVAATAFLEVFGCAWPAGELMDASGNVMQGGYESKWYDRPLKMQRSVLLMLTPQPPVTVGYTGIVPVFSLDYYCSFVSSVFSLFTALRVVMVKDEDTVQRS